jgi:hypothetical protein
MPATQASAIGPVIDALVTALAAALAPIPVYDGTRLGQPPDLQCVIIAGHIEADAEVADMQQSWYGLGAKSRMEDLHIHCLAIGRAPLVPAARNLALAVVDLVAINVPQKPTATGFNALVSSVDSISISAAQSGVTAQVAFTISARAKLAS